MFQKFIPLSLRRGASIGAVSGAAMLALVGCASQSSNSSASDSASGEAVRGTDDSKSPTAAPANGDEKASAKKPSDPGILSEDQFSRLVHGLPRENVSVVIHDRTAVDRDNDGKRDRVLAAVVNDPVVVRFATLGAYLIELVAREPEEKKTFIRAMSDFAMRVARRVSLQEISLNPEDASQLELSAVRELSEWFRRDESLGNSGQDVYSVAGRDRLAVLAVGHGTEPAGDGTSIVRRSLSQLILLRESILRYGSKLWGEDENIAKNRFKCTNLLIKILEADLQAAERGAAPRGAVVDADQKLGEAARRLLQIIVLGAEPVVVDQLRKISRESGLAIVGSGASDAAGFGTFLAFTGEQQSPSSLKRWLMIRELPLDRLCAGTRQIPTVSPSPDQVAFLDQALPQIGPFK